MATTTHTTTQRGYGRAHQLQRARWQPLVDAGHAQCHATTCLMPTRWLKPGEAWDMGHTSDRSDWTGPEHAKCNRSDGGKRHGKPRPARRWVL